MRLKRSHRFGGNGSYLTVSLNFFLLLFLLRLTIIDISKWSGRMSYEKMLQQLKKQQLFPINLLYGTESYFIQNLKTAFIETVLGEDINENLSTYDLEETSIDEVLADVESYPFFGGRKLIIANNPIFLTAKNKRQPIEHDLKKLEAYLLNPVEYSILLFIAPYEKLDNRKKITKLLQKQGEVADCTPIKEHELNKWIKKLANELRIQIEPEAYELFEPELVNLFLLKNELTKLAMFVGENGIVTKQIAEDIMSPSINSSALRLVDAVIARNLERAISIYKNLEKMNEEPIALTALLAFQFRTIFRVKLLKQKGYSQFQIQKQIGAHPYVIKIASERERNFSIMRLETIMDKITNADASMKQGKMEKNLTFELLLYDLIAG